MRKTTRVAVAAGVLILAVGLAVARYEDRKGQEARAPERPAQPLRLSTGYLVPVPAPHPAGGLRIRGVVLGESGPVAGARVTATRPEPGQTLSALTCEEVLGQSGPRKPLAECWHEAGWTLLELVQARQGEAPVYAETTTAGDGGFSLEDLPEGTFALWAADGRGVVLRQDVAAGTEGLELVLGDGLLLEGHVRDEDEGALAGVSVTALHEAHTRFFDAKTGADGRYRLGPLPLARSYTVAFMMEGGERLEVTLKRPRRLQGRVLSGGVPVPDAEVRVVDVRARSTLRTVVRMDAEGRFSVEGLRPSQHQLLASRDARHARLAVYLDRDEPPPEGVLELGTCFQVEGTVRDTAGTPVAGAQVSWGHPASASRDEVALTDAGGHYHLALPLEPGRHDFWVSAPGYVRVERHAVRLGPDTGPVDFTLAPAPALVGRAVDEEGRPVAGAALELRNPRRERGFTWADAEPWADWDIEASFRTDEEGRFRADANEPGAFLLVADSRSGFLREPLEVQVPGVDFRLVLSRGARVSGVVLDERDRPVHPGRGEALARGLGRPRGERRAGGRARALLLLGAAPWTVRARGPPCGRRPEAPRRGAPGAAGE